MSGYDLFVGKVSRIYPHATYSQNVYMQGRRPKYSENFSYDTMGNITSLTRQGFLYSATWGDIDDLVMEYEGNRMVKCDDAAASQPTYSEAHHFADLADASAEYEYDQNGNMTKDLKIPIKREQSKLVCFAEREEFGMKFNRNISKIEYNCLNLPEKTIILGDGMRTYIDNTYDAAGNKLRTTVGRQRVIGPFHPSSSGGVAGPQGGGLTGGLPGGEIVNPIPSSTLITTDYCGNAIYRDGGLSMLLTEEGYVTFASDSVPVYHYYLKDHLGSIRVVFDQDGTVEQRNDYYASGALMPTGTNGTLQPYKFGGKELERTAGLDEYDFGARWMDPVIGGRFTTMDPLCEKYYSISPYTYCGGDPVNFVDPDGRYVLMMFNKDLNELYVLDLDYYNKEKGLTFVDANNYQQGEYNQVLTIKNVFSGGELDENGYIVRNDNNIKERELENGYYDLLDNGADTKHNGWYRVDRIDNHRYNDQDDDYNRNGLRLHFGNLSYGCITISNKQENFEKTQNVLNNIIENTSTITVLDRSGWKRFYSDTQRTNYGTLIVTGNSNYKRKR